MAPKQEPGSVYRLVADNQKGKFGILVAVFGDKPEQTVAKYAQACAVTVDSGPTPVEGMDPWAKGIDARIRAIDEEPGFALVNPLKMVWWDRTLAD